MKICIDIRPALKSTSTGGGKFTLALVNALTPLADYELILYYKKSFFDFKKRCPRVKGSNVSYFNAGGDNLPQADIYITSCYDFIPPQSGKLVFIMYDLIPVVVPELSSSDAGEILLKSLPDMLRRADAVVCISENTKNDLVKFYSPVENKIKVIYPVIDSGYKQINDKEYLRKRLKKIGVSNEYLLFVSSIEPRKNLLNLLKAFSKVKEKFPKMKLVAAGKSVKSYRDVEEYMKVYEFKDDVIFSGYVKQEDLVYLYNGAEVFIFPSFYEGFGLPIAEAFSCGTAVVTSNASSMKEAAGGAAVLVDPYSPGSISEGIMRILADKDYKEELIDYGLKRAKDFNPDRIGNEYRKLFEDILKRI